MSSWANYQRQERIVRERLQVNNIYPEFITKDQWPLNSSHPNGMRCWRPIRSSIQNPSQFSEPRDLGQPAVWFWRLVFLCFLSFFLATCWFPVSFWAHVKIAVSCHIVMQQIIVISWYCTIMGNIKCNCTCTFFLSVALKSVHIWRHYCNKILVQFFSGSPCPHIQTPFSPHGGHGQKARTVYLHFRTGIVA